ncbi:MAG: DUF1801 domain-containing protein [Chloroflexi bacterium]|nr:MAG: DUF1801 domain-containing protein [Chloroflexota bacterium]
MAAEEISLAQHLKQIPAKVRPTFQAARATVRAAAPAAREIVCAGGPPRSKTYMWKIVRYAVGGANVAGIGVFPTYATLFFYRGRELDDGSGLLEGGGKEMRFIRLRTPADVERPAVKRLLRKGFQLGRPAKDR